MADYFTSQPYVASKADEDMSLAIKVSLAEKMSKQHKQNTSQAKI